MRDLTMSVLDGSFNRNLKTKVNVGNLSAQLDGLPTKEEAERLCANRTFLQKTNAAIRRLEQGNYRDKKDYLKDCGYAIFGQMYRELGNEPVDEKTGKKITLQEYMDKQMADKSFERSLKWQTDPKKYIPADRVAQMVRDKEKLSQYVQRKNAPKAGAPSQDIKGPQLSEKQLKLGK